MSMTIHAASPREAFYSTLLRCNGTVRTANAVDEFDAGKSRKPFVIVENHYAERLSKSVRIPGWEIQDGPRNKTRTKGTGPNPLVRAGDNNHKTL